MTFEALLEIADHGGDELIERRADDDPFTVWLAHELEKSFDPKACDLSQPMTAFRTVEQVIVSLDDVKQALLAEFVERKKRD